MKKVKIDSVQVSQLDTHQLSIHALFHYMIGNTDWAVRQGLPNEDCCHNGKVIAPPDSHVGWVVLPYDFDQAGIINTSYALPDEKLRIRSVRQRLYRGFCSGNDQLDATVERFNDSRAAIEGLFSGGPDGSSPDKKALKYLRDFYKTVNDPKKRQKRLVDVCQRTAK